MEGKEINRAIKFIAELSVDRASQVFSKTIKSGAKITFERSYVADITDITSNVYNEEKEIVCSVVDLEGKASFKFLFYIGVEDSFMLTDLILKRQIGTTKEYDIYTQSAVQEIGNILASTVANVISAHTGITIRPKPPIVVKDFLGAVFEEFVLGVIGDRDEILTIETKFSLVRINIDCSMFLIPYQDSEKVLIDIIEDS